MPATQRQADIRRRARPPIRLRATQWLAPRLPVIQVQRSLRLSIRQPDMGLRITLEPVTPCRPRCRPRHRLRLLLPCPLREERFVRCRRQVVVRRRSPALRTFPSVRQPHPPVRLPGRPARNPLPVLHRWPKPLPGICPPPLLRRPPRPPSRVRMPPLPPLASLASRAMLRLERWLPFRLAYRQVPARLRWLRGSWPRWVSRPRLRRRDPWRCLLRHQASLWLLRLSPEVP